MPKIQRIQTTKITIVTTKNREDHVEIKKNLLKFQGIPLEQNNCKKI